MLQINSFDLFEVLAYLFGWTTLYFVLCLCNTSRSYEWHCRMVTVIHALVISFMAFYSTFILGPWPFTDAGGPNSPLQVRTVGLCLGYFIFDFSWCMYFKTEGLVMVAHHFLSIVGLTWCLMSGQYGTELIATIGGAEVTNPLLQLRWFLRELKYHHTIWADLVEWAFMLSFGFIRLGLGSVLLYAYYCQDTDFWGRLGGTTIYGLGVIFFISILNYAIRKYTRRYKAWVKEKGHKEKITQHGQGDSNGKDVDILSEQELPSQREIKNGIRELTVRKNCAVQKTQD